MYSEIQKLKDKLDKLITEIPISSQEILNLSREIDVLIAKYQRNS